MTDDKYSAKALVDALLDGARVAVERAVAAEAECARLREAATSPDLAATILGAVLCDPELGAASAEACGQTNRIPSSLWRRIVIATVEACRRRDAARAEADALRAIVEGRAVAPTDAERAAHAGEWLVRYRSLASEPARAIHWWPLDATGRPTTWPTGGGL